MSLMKNPTTGKFLELFGPTVEYLTSPQDTQNDFCVLKGTIPPGVFVPLHSHPDTEDFLVISGELEGLKQDSEDHA
jgi:quercetin dioxygenase-like cupin family protein